MGNYSTIYVSGKKNSFSIQRSKKSQHCAVWQEGVCWVTAPANCLSQQTGHLPLCLCCLGCHPERRADRWGGHTASLQWEGGATGLVSSWWCSVSLSLDTPYVYFLCLFMRGLFFSNSNLSKWPRKQGWHLMFGNSWQCQAGNFLLRHFFVAAN